MIKKNIKNIIKSVVIVATVTYFWYKYIYAKNISIIQLIYNLNINCVQESIYNFIFFNLKNQIIIITKYLSYKLKEAVWSFLDIYTRESVKVIKKFIELIENWNKNPENYLKIEGFDDISIWDVINIYIEQIINLTIWDKIINFIELIINFIILIINFSILDLFNYFINYLSNFSIYEYCIVFNVIISIFIFICLIKILFTIYGNYLILKFSLEKLLPKLNSIIKSRIKLEHYYIISNSLYICLAIIILLFVNLFTLKI
jgi:hypothetical protein